MKKEKFIEYMINCHISSNTSQILTAFHLTHLGEKCHEVSC